MSFGRGVSIPILHWARVNELYIFLGLEGAKDVSVNSKLPEQEGLHSYIRDTEPNVA